MSEVTEIKKSNNGTKKGKNNKLYWYIYELLIILFKFFNEFKNIKIFSLTH